MVLNDKSHIRYQLINSSFGDVVIAFIDNKIVFLEFIEESLSKTLLNLKEIYAGYELVEEKSYLKFEELLDINKFSWDDIFLNCSQFKKDVLKALFNIPFGELISYSKLADLAGHPTAVRAVASAVANNPISIIIPCHRVIRKSDDYGNYRWGVSLKKDIIEWERSNGLIKAKLFSLAKGKYKKFTQGLIPTNSNIMLGVTIPNLRELAKEILANNPKSFIDNCFSNITAPTYYEEIMVLGIVLARAKIPIEERFLLYKKFIPLIDNWAVCDILCGESKWAKKDIVKSWEFIINYIASPNCFEVRFSVIMMLSQFLDIQHLKDIFYYLDKIDYKEEYYVDMAVAWLLATAFAKFPEQTFLFLQTTKIPISVLKKTAQKIRDSRRVSSLDKVKVTDLINSYK